MKRTISAGFVLSLFFVALVAPVASHASDQLIPAGSIVTCSVSEGRISSQTQAVGDLVLCTLGPVEKYGRGQFPYGAYMEGRFEAYKAPGHFVGKGWMELKFDRMVIGNRVIPVSAKVVQVPKYKVSSDGRILGNGHATRDTIEWLIPVLWPIDLIELPRRGPRPVLKAETPLTLELMEDVGIPDNSEIGYPPPQQRAALIERQQPPPQQQPVIYQNFQQAPPQPAPPQQPQVVYQQSPPQTVVVQSSPQVVYRYVPVAPPPPPVYYPYGYRYYGPGY